MPYPFKHCTCNEGFDKWDFAEACRAIRKAGYTGIEIAPFTLAENPVEIPNAKRTEYCSIIRNEGLTFAGLHWLMVSPKGLHVTTPDKALREKSWRFVWDLIDLCADLGPNGVMVFGSPKQRCTTGGIGREEATKHYIDGMAFVAPHAVERGVTVLVEALPVGQSDVVTALDEAAAIVRQIASPGIRTMFDSHNAVDETEPHAAIVERNYDVIRHIHVNEMDGRRPGLGDYDFKPVFEALARRGYRGWISLEAFDFKPDPVTVVTDSLRYLESEIEKVKV